jgi:hypothetical protein
MHGLDPSKFRNVNANKLASSHRVVARFVQKLFEICVFGAHQPRNRFPLVAPRIFTRHARARPHQVQKCECKQIGIIAQGRCNIRSKVIRDLRVGSIRSLCIWVSNNIWTNFAERIWTPAPLIWCLPIWKSCFPRSQPTWIKSYSSICLNFTAQPRTHFWLYSCLSRPDLVEVGTCLSPTRPNQYRWILIYYFLLHGMHMPRVVGIFTVEIGVFEKVVKHTIDSRCSVKRSRWLAGPHTPQYNVGKHKNGSRKVVVPIEPKLFSGKSGFYTSAERFIFGHSRYVLRAFSRRVSFFGLKQTKSILRNTNILMPIL